MAEHHDFLKERNEIHSLAVFCASSDGVDTKIFEDAYKSPFSLIILET